MKAVWENPSIRRKTCLIATCVPHMSDRLAWERNQASQWDGEDPPKTRRGPFEGWKFVWIIFKNAISSSKQTPLLPLWKLDVKMQFTSIWIKLPFLKVERPVERRDRKIMKNDYQLRHVVMPACLSAWNRSVPTGPISMKFEDFSKIFWKNSSLIKTR
jgi:hypothetical protein